VPTTAPLQRTPPDRPARSGIREVLFATDLSRVRLGAICEGIVEAARVERADCIVMATCGHDSPQDRILGTRAERVIRTAPCPVLAL
jgi:nucleotide-binding universal stress UspA family protein